MPDSDVARLRWQCRRGMRELDELFLGYLNTRFHTAPADEQAAFQRLLEHQDQSLFEWMTGKALPADISLHGIVARLRQTASD